MVCFITFNFFQFKKNSVFYFLSIIQIFLLHGKLFSFRQWATGRQRRTPFRSATSPADRASRPPSVCCETHIPRVRKKDIRTPQKSFYTCPLLVSKDLFMNPSYQNFILRNIPKNIYTDEFSKILDLYIYLNSEHTTMPYRRLHGHLHSTGLEMTAMTIKLFRIICIIYSKQFERERHYSGYQFISWSLEYNQITIITKIRKYIILFYWVSIIM